MRRTLAVIIGIAVILGVALSSLTGIWSDFMWFSSLGYQQVFWTQLLTRYGVGLAAFVPAFAFLVFNFWYVRGRVTRHRAVPTNQDNVVEIGEHPINKAMKSRGGTVLLLGFSAFLALILAAAPGGQWEMVQRFLHATPFGKTDPIFALDTGFYVFQLPFWEALRSWLMSVFIVAFLVSAVFYSIFDPHEFTGGGWRVFSPAKLHLALLVAGILLLKVWGYRLAAYQLLYSSYGVVFGAGYTDVHARLPVLKIMMVIAILAAAAVMISVYLGRPRLTAGSIAVFIAASILLGSGYPALVQKFQVEPNQFNREQPYLENNMAATRYAYGLDQAQQVNLAPQSGGVNQETLRQNSEALSNLRLWDYRPLGQVYNQLQQLRSYYSFNDVDVDRYTLSGTTRQVMLSVREIQQENLAEQAQTWVNRRLLYTHGYGAVVSPVNEIAPRGLPAFLVSDIPLKAAAPELELNRPEIYYGELTDNTVIVNTKAGEFDYPSGQTNVYTNYKGQGGVQLNTWRRLAYAIHFRDLRMLLSAEIGPESRILYNRTVEDARRLAPYLTFDQDPYPVIARGKLYWIWDAYTTTNHYPYSEPFGRINYIRNSVKVVVDAYNGSYKFYIADHSDPLIQTYEKIFPSLYLPLIKMPDELRSHLRYPEDYFDIQSTVYASYHIRDARVFYNREDEWAVPATKTAEEAKPFEPYYAMMQLPGESGTEYVLIRPFTPKNRENLVAWIAARCDREKYGQLMVYTFPKDTSAFGPNQVEAAIDQDAEISQELTLWNQHGSQVIRGNLITVPIAGDLLYVEPLFLQAKQNSLPELIRVITSYQGRVVMANNLTDSLEQLFSLTLAPPTGMGSQPDTESGQADTTSESTADLARRANELFQQAQERLRAGDWSGYGQVQQSLGEVLNRMVSEMESK